MLPLIFYQKKIGIKNFQNIGLQVKKLLKINSRNI